MKNVWGKNCVVKEKTISLIIHETNYIHVLLYVESLNHRNKLFVASGIRFNSLNISNGNHKLIH